MGYSIEAIRDFSFNKVCFDEYELIVDDKNYTSTSWTTATMVEISKFFDSFGIPDMWDKLLTGNRDIPTYLTNEDVQWFNNLPKPKECLRLLNEYQILEKAKPNEHILFCLEWLKDKWEAGFTVYWDY